MFSGKYQSLRFFFLKKKTNAAKPLRFLIAAYRRRNQILFFAMPRTSSGSIGEVLAKHGIEIHGHRRRPGYKFLRDRDDCKNVQIISVVRHPYSRFLSAYFALVKGGYNAEDKEDALKFMKTGESVNAFISRHYKAGGNSPDLLSQRHFTPQFDYLKDIDGRLLPVRLFVFGQKDFMDDLFRYVGISKRVTITQQHVTKKNQELSQSSKDILQLWYERDFEFFFKHD